MRRALRLAERGFGLTSPNPMVGAVLVKHGAIIGCGWHERAGFPHAEIEALRDAAQRGASVKGSVLYVTLEPCSTHGRTPPCTDTILASGIARVIAAATDPNPRHAGRGFKLLRAGGVEVGRGVLEEEAERLNEGFNHWIVRGTPFVTVKAAMSLDGKIATSGGESKWITGEQARFQAMKLRRGADAVLVGVNTVLADNPSLTCRPWRKAAAGAILKPVRRIVLDSEARLPLTANLVADQQAALTTVVVTERAPKSRIQTLAKAVTVWTAPARKFAGGLDLDWLLRRLGAEGVVNLLVEGGGEVNASFLTRGLAQRVAFFYAPQIIGGRTARKAVAGEGVSAVRNAMALFDVEWNRFGPDFFMTARIAGSGLDR